jgi:hypothetical protein
MRERKKDNYWGTSVRHYITDGVNKFKEEGVIYINLRDSPSDNKIIEVIKHELSHIIDNQEDLKNMLHDLDELKEGEANARGNH